MIDTGSGINWSNVYIPEGRTQKAVMHMLAKEKQKWGTAPKDGGNKSASPGDGAMPVQTPKPAKTATGAKKSNVEGQEKMNGKRKRSKKTEEPIKTEENSDAIEDPHADPDVKKIKLELEHVADQLHEAMTQDEA
jgi:peptide subunit release factor 1 (eRF1)